MRAYPILTIECPSQAGGVKKAQEIVANMVMKVGGLDFSEFNQLCVIELVHDQICLLIPGEVLAKRVRRWKHQMNNILWNHKRNRQVSGYMFHSAHKLRTV